MINYSALDTRLNTEIPSHPDGIRLSDFQFRCGQIDILASTPNPQSLERLFNLLTREEPREPKIVRLAAASALLSLWGKGGAEVLEEAFCHPHTGRETRVLMTKELILRSKASEPLALSCIRSLCADDRVKLWWKEQLSQALTSPSIDV